MIDYVEIAFTSGIPTQFRHIQSALKEIIPRPPGKLHWIKNTNGTEASATEFIVTIQDPIILELLKVDELLRRRFKMTGFSAIVAVEVSVDFYPISTEDDERSKIVGVLQRCYLPKFDAYTNRRDRPRFVTDSPDDSTNSLTTYLYPSHNSNAPGARDSWLKPESARIPFIDKIIYIGEKESDNLTRIQNKIGNKRVGKVFEALTQDTKRARMEITLKGKKLSDIGIIKITDLAAFNFATLQKEFFHFALPTFPDDYGSERMDAIKRVTNHRNIEHFLKTGHSGMGFVELGRKNWIDQVMPDVRAQLKSIGKLLKRRRVGMGVHGNTVAFAELNDMAQEALRNLTKRCRRRS